MTSRWRGRTRTRSARNSAKTTDAEFISMRRVCNGMAGCGWNRFRRGWSSSWRENKFSAAKKLLCFDYRLAGLDVQSPRFRFRQPQFSVADLQRHPEIAGIPLRARLPDVAHENHRGRFCADDLHHHRGLRAVG